jgi:hypothetical protein
MVERLGPSRFDLNKRVRRTRSTLHYNKLPDDRLHAAHYLSVVMRAKRHFTVDEANRTLPLVRRIVADILSAGQHLRDAAKATAGGEQLSQQQRLEKQLKDLLGELEQLGCFYKDWNYTVGLVDFPALIEDEEVLLCWRSDEPEIRFYHRYTDGYAGRKPLTASVQN